MKKRNEAIVKIALAAVKWNQLLAKKNATLEEAQK